MTENEGQSLVKIYNRDTYEPGRYDKTLMAGSPDDARDYVVNNFPRHHDAQVAMPEVYVEHADGTHEHYYGGEWVNPTAEDTTVEPVEPVEADDTETEIV